jgi:hypothetical protein
VDVNTFAVLRKTLSTHSRNPELFQDDGGFTTDDLPAAHPDVVSNIGYAVRVKRSSIRWNP